MSKIVSDPIDNKTKIIGLPDPKPEALSKDMLHGIKTRAFKKRGFLLPEDCP